VVSAGWYCRARSSDGTNALEHPVRKGMGMVSRTTAKGVIRLRGRDGRFLPDPTTLADVAARPAFTVGLLRYLERQVRYQSRVGAKARRTVIQRRTYTWTPGGRFRRRVATSRIPRDERGRFVGTLRWQHGTEASYRNHCRCPDCAKVWRDRMRAYMRFYRSVGGGSGSGFGTGTRVTSADHRSVEPMKGDSTLTAPRTGRNRR
jgi:hypothetical protein